MKYQIYLVYLIYFKHQFKYQSSKIFNICAKFKPQVSDESCDPFEWGSAAKAFWQGEFDRTLLL